MFLSNFPFNLLHSLFVRGIDWLGVAEGLNYLALDAGPTQVSGLQAEHILIISALDPDQDIKEKYHRRFKLQIWAHFQIFKRLQ